MKMLKSILLLIFCILLIKEIQGYVKGKVCKTKQCKTSADHLKACMNESVDPCQNFYQYACGNVASVLNEDGSANDFFDLVQNKIKKSVMDVLKDKKKHPCKAVETSKQLFKSCLDTDTMNEKGLKPLNEILKFVGLPTHSPLSKPTNRFNWVTVAAKMKRVLNLNFLITVDVMPDSKNRSINRISVSKSSGYLGTGPDYSSYVRSMHKRGKIPQLSDSDDNTGNSITELYHYVRNISNIFDQSPRKKNKSQKKKFKAMSNQLVSFIFERILLENKNMDDSDVPELMTLNELQEFTDSAIKGFYSGKLVLDWKKYITTLFEGTKITLNLENGEDKIAVSNRNYLKEAIALIEKKQKILESALWWDVIQEIGPFATDELRKLDADYRTSILETPRDREELCQGAVRKYFSFALAHAFLKDPMVNEYQNQTEEMVVNLKLGFEKIIDTSNWMDSQTKTQAKKKLNSMRTYVSHPDWLNNISSVNEYFEDYKIDQKDFVKTIFLIEQEIVNNTLLALRDINDIEEEAYDSYPLVTNAFYSSSDNSMMIPMGMIEFPFMGHSTQALNYGSLGFIVGHEITHGFDTEGKRHDEVGNIRRWWKNSTLNEYKNRTTCFIESYSQIEIGDDNVDGMQTLDENIADNGGYKESLLAYRNYVQSKGAEPPLEGLEGFTSEQLFTLAFANAWCSLSSEVSIFDKHSPDEARVLGVLKNSREFQEIWKCNKNSPMNPADKCQIW